MERRIAVEITEKSHYPYPLVKWSKLQGGLHGWLNVTAFEDGVDIEIGNDHVKIDVKEASMLATALLRWLKDRPKFEVEEIFVVLKESQEGRGYT